MGLVVTAPMWLGLPPTFWMWAAITGAALVFAGLASLLGRFERRGARERHDAVAALYDELAARRRRPYDWEGRGL